MTTECELVSLQVKDTGSRATHSEIIVAEVKAIRHGRKSPQLRGKRSGDRVVTENPGYGPLDCREKSSPTSEGMEPVRPFADRSSVVTFPDSEHFTPCQ